MKSSGYWKIPKGEEAILLYCLGVAWLWICTITGPVHAAPKIWNDLGLNGGRVQTLALHPVNPNIIFSGIYTGMGLYRTSDGADSWQALEMEHNHEGEDTFENHSVLAVAIAPANPQIVWVAHNYWVAKSTDGGNTWTHIRNGTMQKDCRHCGGTWEDQFRLCVSIAIDPDDAETVYVGTAGPVGTYAGGAVYRTTDGGTTWEKLNGGRNLDYTVTSVVLDIHTPGGMWITTNSHGIDNLWDGSVYRSTDGGASFSTPDPRPISGSGVNGLTLHPMDPDVVFVSSGFGVIRMAVDGSNWHPAVVVEGSALASPVAFAPSNGAMAYVGWYRPSTMGGDNIAKLSRTNDGGLTWETLPMDPMLASQVYCVVVDPDNADILYWADRSGGVLKSEDGGQTWRPVNNGLTGAIIYDVETDPRDTDHLIAGTTAGVYERIDGIWHKRLNQIAHAVRFDPIDSRSYYAGLDYSLAKTRDGGDTWRFSSDLPNGIISHIEIDPGNTEKVFISDESHVQRSTDGGATFTPVLEGINSSGQSHNMNVVAIDPKNTQRILAGGGNFYVPNITGGLWESLDGGDTWQTTGLTDVIVNDILIHPDTPSIVYIGCGHSSNSEIPLHKSTDGGKTWTSAMSGLPPEQILLDGLWTDGTGNITAVGSFGNHLRITHDGRKTRSEISPEDLNDIFGVTGEIIYAVGDNGTLLKYDGMDWSVVPVPSTVDLHGIWGDADGHLFVVGEEGLIMWFDGASWSVMPSPVSVRLYKIFGNDRDTMVAVGAGGAILHYDGSQWAVVSSPVTEDLSELWGTPDGYWFAGGANGTMVTFDGETATLINSGTNADIEGLWGDSEQNLYAVTFKPGKLLRYDGSDWFPTDAPVEHLVDIWGVSGEGIYIAQQYGGILSFDHTQWEILRPPGSRFRSVVDLEFHPVNPGVIYAATSGDGVFLSPNSGKKWLNLGTPQHDVNAIAMGSLYAATKGGLYQLTGTGVLAGQVYDAHNMRMIDGVRVTTAMGLYNTAIDGEYMLVVPSGIFDIYATADQHQMAITRNVSVTGGDITWQDFEMQSGMSSDIGPEGALTVDRRPSGGGSYCFIGVCSPMPNIGIFWIGLLIWLAAGFVMQAVRVPVIRFGGRLLLCFAGLVMTPPQADAFTLFQQVDISSPPLPVGSGARAMGMGGAFIATADDATAASWNPAGLVQLERPEISIVVDGYFRKEVYSSELQPEVNNTGHNDHYNLNFFSATFPMHWQKNLVFSINYQRLFDFHRDLNYRRNLAERDVQLAQQVTFNQSGSLGAVGLAGAVEITPRISLGVTVNIWTDQLGRDNGWKANYNDSTTGTQAGVPTTIHTHIRDTYEEFRGINFTLGLLWDLNYFGGLGLVVKTPFTATIQHHFLFEQRQTFGAPLDTSVTNGPVLVDEEVELNLPLSYGVGWSKRFSDRFTLGVDLYRSEWSDYYLENGQGDEFSPIDGRPRTDSDVEATTHLRIGGEYLLLWPGKKMAVPVRMGFFYDPEPGEDEPEDVFGIALGSGISTQTYSIDLAYQYRWAQDINSGNIIAETSADIEQHTVLASLIYYF